MCFAKKYLYKIFQVCPPLVTAARNGHLNIVEVLLSSEFKSGEVLESSGKVLLGGYVIDGATPLWCAAGSVRILSVN